MVQNFQEAFDIVGVKIRSIFTSIRVYAFTKGLQARTQHAACAVAECIQDRRLGGQPF